MKMSKVYFTLESIKMVSIGMKRCLSIISRPVRIAEIKEL